MIEAKVKLWQFNRSELENMLTTLTEQNMSRGVYISLEGGRVVPEDDGKLIECIIEELASTVRALNKTEKFNRPPLTEEEKRRKNDEFLAAEMGFDDVDEYLAWEKQRGLDFMKQFTADCGIELPEGVDE